jgi:hypothetical protein
MNDVSNYSLNKLDLGQDNVGFCVIPPDKTVRDSPMGTYMPKLMSEIPMGQKPWTKKVPVSSSMIKNSNMNITFSPVTTCNYFDVPPLRNSNTEQPIPYKGETVSIKFIDNDIKKVYYETKFVDESHRTNDSHRIFVKDKLTKSSPDKEYEFYMDSDDQVIRFFMDNGRNEKSQYTFEMNGKDGSITMKDTKGNSFLLDTVNSRVKLTNASGSSVDLNGSSINLNATNGVFVNGSRIGDDINA